MSLRGTWQSHFVNLKRIDSLGSKTIFLLDATIFCSEPQNKRIVASIRARGKLEALLYSPLFVIARNDAIYFDNFVILTKEGSHTICIQVFVELLYEIASCLAMTNCGFRLWKEKCYSPNVSTFHQSKISTLKSIIVSVFQSVGRGK